MIRRFPCLILVLMGTVVLTGCPYTAEMKKRHQVYIDGSMEKVREINSLAKAFAPEREFRLVFQDQIKGLRGESHGTISGSQFLGSGSISGSVEGTLENAKSFVIGWQDRGGAFRQNTIPAEQVGFKVRNGKPAAVRFKVNTSKPTEAAVMLEINNIYGTSDRENINSWLDASLGNWRLSKENPAMYIKSNLDQAVVYASAKQLREYFGISIPGG